MQFNFWLQNFNTVNSDYKRYLIIHEEIYKQKCFHEIFFGTNSFDHSTDCQNLWINFSENHFDFCRRIFSISGLSITNISSYCSKSYAFVVLSDFEVTFLSEGEDAAFCSSFYRIFLYNPSMLVSKKINFLFKIF